MIAPVIAPALPYYRHHVEMQAASYWIFSGSALPIANLMPKKMAF